MTHTIIISSADTACCNAILSSLNSGDSVCSVSGISGSPDTLLRLVEECLPAVILIDCVSFRDSYVEQIQLLRFTYGYSVMILALGPRDFDCISRAVHAGANDYILMPIDSGELLSSLSSLIVVYEKEVGKENADRRFFLTDKSINMINDHPLSLQQLNATYNTHFRGGVFQMLFVKFDSSGSFDPPFAENPSFIEEMRGIPANLFNPLCHDILYEVKKDGFMILLNYEAESGSVIDSKILELYRRVVNLLKAYISLDTTIGVSQAVSNINKIGELKKQVRDTEWYRMHYGQNKIIYWKPTGCDLDGTAQKALDQIMNSTISAIDSLNISKFKISMYEFYSLSYNILISRSAQTFIRKVISRIFQTYWETISVFADPTEDYEDISYSLHMCTSFDQHKRTLIAKCSELMENISTHSKQKYSPAITQVLSYISANTDKPLLLEDAAEYANLSVGYLSSLFKKETGVNFTKYVSTQKNTAACDLLRSSSLNISEIAQKTGYPDVRAFSKKFHAMNGISPSEYRKLHAKKQTEIL